jgi:hypothetical protein
VAAEITRMPWRRRRHVALRPSSKTEEKQTMKYLMIAAALFACAAEARAQSLPSIQPGGFVFRYSTPLVDAAIGVQASNGPVTYTANQSSKINIFHVNQYSPNTTAVAVQAGDWNQANIVQVGRGMSLPMSPF